MTHSPAVDVVVVGAGLSGLSAARNLVALGHSVHVFEANDRVGGRTLNHKLDGANVDLGGTFVGPTQDRILALAQETACAHHPTNTVGESAVSWRGRVRRYSGTVPSLGVGNLVDIGRLQFKIDRLAKTLPQGTPWDGKNAAELDSHTLASWLAAQHASQSSKDLFAIVAKTSWGCEPAEISMLYVLDYIRGCGGIDRMLATKGGAQQEHFPDGTQTISMSVAERLGESISLGSAVRKIDWSGAGVAVSSVARTVTAKAVIVAVPPAMRSRIDFDPILPVEHRSLGQRWPQGVLTKVYARYERPFWRDNGLNGQSLSDTGPVFATFDTSPSADGPGVLLGFIGADYARSYDRLPPHERRLRALSSFATVFGDDAMHPTAFVDQRWAGEEWIGGGPTAAVPPGALTRYGSWLARPIGPIHWAGTETADRWAGYMDGAVRAGERAARECLATVENRD